VDCNWDYTSYWSPIRTAIRVCLRAWGPIVLGKREIWAAAVVERRPLRPSESRSAHARRHTRMAVRIGLQ